MKYTKPTVLQSSTASSVIQNIMGDKAGGPQQDAAFQPTNNPAYEDEE